MTTAQIRNFMRSKLKIGDYVTLKADKCAANDERLLCNQPVGLIRNILPDGTYLVGNRYFRNDEGQAIYKKDEITKFLLLVEVGDNNFLGIYDHFYERFDIIEIRDLYSGDIRSFSEDYLNDGISIIKDPIEFLEQKEKISKHQKSLANVRAMREVSKKGVMEHLPLNPNTQAKIMSYLTGYDVAAPNEKAHLKILQEYLTRPRGAPGAGVNTRYGKKLPRPSNISEFNNALSQGPLPYGPTEENFAGGKRKSRKNRKTRKASRKKL